jgi:hypothetical protein
MIGKVWRSLKQKLLEHIGGAGVFNLAQFFASDIYRFSLLQFLYGLFVVGAYPAPERTVKAVYSVLRQQPTGLGR